MTIRGVGQLVGVGDASPLQQGLHSYNGSAGASARPWDEIVQRVTHYVGNLSQASPGAAARMNQLSELCKLQVQMSQYQLKVELVSKVSESAVASVRKLQQPQ